MIHYYQHPTKPLEYASEPWSREAAIEVDAPMWRDETPCPDCGTRMCYRFTASNICANCATLEYSAIAFDKADPEKARFWRGPVKGGSKPCRRGPHLHIVDEAGKCKGCIAEGLTRITPATQIRNGLGVGLTRAQAKAGGFPLYRGAPCPHQHDGWRIVRTGVCYHCENGGRPADAKSGRPMSEERQFTLDNPEMLFDKAAARAVGFPYYRTGEVCRKGHKGWRRVDSGACLECRS